MQQLTELNDTKNKLADLNNRINSLTSELNNTKTQLSNEIKKSAELNNRVNSLTSELNDTKNKLAYELNKSRDLNNRVNSSTSQNKNISQNSDFIIWNGKDIKDFGVDPEGYVTYQEFVKASFIEDEFETVAESEERFAKSGLVKSGMSSGMLNAYFGVQNINMRYTADKTEFNVSINGFANFKVTVPRNIAKEFKEQVKSFDFNFDRNFQLDSISVLFNNQLFYGRDFNKDLLAELEKERLVIAFKTITIDNLMFQDAELPKAMNWNDACKYCENLRLLGFSDWRLPTIEELKIAYQHRSKFRNKQDSWYWSICKDDTSDSCVLVFGGGYEASGDQSYDNLFRCVR